MLGRISQRLWELSDRHNVVVYNPKEGKEITHDDPERFIVEKCLMGQPKDDIFKPIFLDGTSE